MYINTLKKKKRERERNYFQNNAPQYSIFQQTIIYAYIVVDA